MTRTSKRFICILLSVFLLIATLPITVSVSATGTVIEVSTAQQLTDACSTINSNGGEYTISLQADITGYVTVNNETAVVTLVGNGHTLTQPTAVVNVIKGTLNLGDGNSALTLKSEGTQGDEPGIIYVWGENAVCNMYDKVTVTGRKNNNYFGGGATVGPGTFHMYGGTITDCGVDGGSVCFGGGVAAIGGGKFIMDGGLITNCYVKNAYHGENGYTGGAEINGAGGGVVVVNGGSFEMNGGEISNCESDFGGGAALLISYEEIMNYYNTYGVNFGYTQNIITINDGTIKDNSAAFLGGGVFSSGYYYTNNPALATNNPPIGYNAKTGTYINGGNISENSASEGGGVFVSAMNTTDTQKTLIHGATISKNTAEQGAGIEAALNWLQADIDGCTITDNIASANGGGIMLQGNKKSNGTQLKNSVITGNKSGDRGAGVYYDDKSKLTISGANTIQNNTLNGVDNNLNIYSKDYPVYVGGALTGSQIGLSDPRLWDDGLEDVDPAAESEIHLTSGYSQYNTASPVEVFTSDHNGWFAAMSDVTTNEVRLVRRPPEYLDKVTFTKTYQGKTGYSDAGTVVIPDGKLTENITFSITPYKSFNREVGKTDIPAFGEASYTITVDGNEADELAVNLPDFTGLGVGDYWYEVKETAGNTAGVSYDSNTYYLHVVVSHEDVAHPDAYGISQVTLHKTAPADDGTYTNNADDKTQGFTNQFSSGSLTVTKKIDGTFADRTKKFDIVVTLTAPEGKTVTGPITYSGTETIAGGWTGSKTVTLSLGLNESVTFTNIPDGVTYTVKENDYSSDGYEIPTYTFDNASETGDTVLTGSDWSGVYASGSISDSADTVTVKNKKDATIDVGVITENAPFVVVILLVIGLAVFMIIKRRRSIEE